MRDISAIMAVPADCAPAVNLCIDLTDDRNGNTRDRTVAPDEARVLRRSFTGDREPGRGAFGALDLTGRRAATPSPSGADEAR